LLFVCVCQVWDLFNMTPFCISTCHSMSYAWSVCQTPFVLNYVSTRPRHCGFRCCVWCVSPHDYNTFRQLVSPLHSMTNHAVIQTINMGIITNSLCIQNDKKNDKWHDWFKFWSQQYRTWRSLGLHYASIRTCRWGKESSYNGVKEDFFLRNDDERIRNETSKDYVT